MVSIYSYGIQAWSVSLVKRELRYTNFQMPTTSNQHITETVPMGQYEHIYTGPELVHLQMS